VGKEKIAGADRTLEKDWWREKGNKVKR